MKSSSTFTLTIVSVLAVGSLGMYFMLRGSGPSTPSSATASNVVAIDGNQIVNIAVKGGYSPQASTVKAGVPVTLRFKTNGTFDCSSAIRISTLGISKTLPSSGETDVPLGSLSPGMVEGTCGMGMYRFTLNVQG